MFETDSFPTAIVLPSYCDALSDHGQPVGPASDRHAALSEHCSAGDCALCGMQRWLQQLAEVGREVVPSHEQLSETIGVLSHRPIVLGNTIDYRTIGFSHNRPNPSFYISKYQTTVLLMI